MSNTILKLTHPDINGIIDGATDISSIDKLRKILSSVETIENGELVSVGPTGEMTYTVEPAEIDSAGIFPSLSQKIKLKGSSGLFSQTFNTDGLLIWPQFVEQSVSPRGFSNVNMTLKLPIVDEATRFTDTNLVDSEFIYNYEFYNYDFLTNLVDERTLPSHLAWDYKEHLMQNNYRQDMAHFIETFGDNLTFPNQVLKKDVKWNDQNAYLFNVAADNGSGYQDPEDTFKEVKSLDDNVFKKYTKDRISDLESEFATYDFDMIQNKMSNVFVFYDHSTNLTDYLPYYLKFNLPPLQNMDDFGNPFGPYGPVDFGLDKTLIETRMHRFLFTHMKRMRPSDIRLSANVDGEDRGVLPYNSWNLQSWWTSENFDNLPEGTDELILSSEEDDFLDKPAAFFERLIRKVATLGSIRSAITNKLMDFEQCALQNEPTAKAVLGYKIEKREFEPDGRIIQTFFLPSLGKTNVEFIDSQLKYDKRYYYSISMFVLFVQQNYSYTIDNISTTDFEADITFRNTPELKVVEVPFATTVERAIEPPVLPPKVDIFHEMQTPNKVKFILSDNHGNNIREEDQQPLNLDVPNGQRRITFIPITQNDEEYKNKLRESCKASLDIYGYSSRAATQKFDVFKITTKPESYDDFADGFVGSIAEDYGPYTKDSRGPTTFTDYIAHEQKYYYLFRALSTHDNPSNPSFVYEVELLQDADEVILNWNSFRFFEKDKDLDYHKTFRRFMQIIPRPNHVMIDTDQFTDMSTAPASISLGSTEADLDDSVWGFNSKQPPSNPTEVNKYIKLRLTSKHTGKKIDINLTFTLKDSTN